MDRTVATKTAWDSKSPSFDPRLEWSDDLPAILSAGHARYAGRCAMFRPELAETNIVHRVPANNGPSCRRPVVRASNDARSEVSLSPRATVINKQCRQRECFLLCATRDQHGTESIDDQRADSFGTIYARTGPCRAAPCR